MDKLENGYLRIEVLPMKINVYSRLSGEMN